MPRASTAGPATIKVHVQSFTPSWTSCAQRSRSTHGDGRGSADRHRGRHQPPVRRRPRQRLFEQWTTSLGLPLRERPAGLSLTHWVENDATTLLLLESDEPLPFSRDVNLELSRSTEFVTTAVFTDGATWSS
jgi:hypothetical protein